MNDRLSFSSLLSGPDFYLFTIPLLFFLSFFLSFFPQSLESSFELFLNDQKKTSRNFEWWNSNYMTDNSIFVNMVILFPETQVAQIQK